MEQKAEEVVEMVHIGRTRMAAGRPATRRGVPLAVLALVIGSAGVALAACGARADSGGGTHTASSTAAASQAKTDSVSLIGKIDADAGAPGTFTGKEHWPAVSPSDIHVSAGATVVLTIKEYDDMVTALPAGSAYHSVMGGTETVNGKRVSSVDNSQIAHTITIPTLGINIPLPKAPEGGFTTVRFTFRAPRSGTYEWECMTPCGGGTNGMGGAMHMDGWMRGHLVVS